ncbi:AMP-binding protein [Actinosynnema sp. CA-248983]
MSVYDVFGVLAAGGTAVLPEPATNPDPDQWLALARERSVTFWAAVPALMDLVVSRAETLPDAGLDGLRTVVLAGDWIPLTLPDRLRAVAPGVRPISCGGPAETTNWSIAHPIVPSIVHFHTEFPLSRNGKVDRSGLVARPVQAEPATGARTLRESTPVERAVAELWADVLDVPEVGPDDTFFALGGNSMLASAIALRLRELFQVDVPLRTVLDEPTPADLAAALLADPRTGEEVRQTAQLLADLRDHEDGGLTAAPAEAG